MNFLITVPNRFLASFFRNAAMAERKFNMDQRRTENTLSTNRQSDLEKEYKDEFRDGRRVDAIDAIEAKLAKDKKRGQPTSVDQIQAYRLACLIFEVTNIYNERVKTTVTTD